MRRRSREPVRALANCSTVGYRSAGALARARRTAASSSGETVPPTTRADGLREGAGDPEVRHHGTPLVQQDVLRLDVAMQHSPSVCRRKGARDVARDPHGFVDRQLLLVTQPVAQRLARDVRHDEEHESVALVRVEHGQDVRVVEFGGDFDLEQEPIAPQRGGPLGLQNLDRDFAVVLQVVREEDRRERTPAYLPCYTIAIGECGLYAFELVPFEQAIRPRMGLDWPL